MLGTHSLRTRALSCSAALMSKSKREKLKTPAVGEKPHQPLSFEFPKRSFGQKTVVQRTFQPQWFSRWKWLHYVEDSDAAFCFTCVKAYSENKLFSVSSLQSTYISNGHTNWKDATTKFAAHEGSNCHKEAVLKMITLPATTHDIAESLSAQVAVERLDRRQCFLMLLSNIRFLARQALPLRGDGDESNSNYIQRFKLCGKDDARVFDWLRKKKQTNTLLQTCKMKC